MATQKWFYLLQRELDKFLEATFDRHQCNWQTVSKDIVVECYNVKKKDQQHEVAVIFCHYKHGGHTTMFEGGNRVSGIK